MVQSSEHIWTRRFQLLLGLTLAGQIILGIIVYRIFEYSYARTEFALTAFLLVCGIVALSSLQEPIARRIILGAGTLILVALLALLASPGAPGSLSRAQIPGQPAETLQQFLASSALVVALVAWLGKIVTDRATRIADVTYERNSWFAGLEHLVLAAIAGVELFLQISSGSQIRALPFSTVVYAGLSLNTITILLLGAIVVFSLVSFSSALTWLDALMILILGVVCALFQYTFGTSELTRLDPELGRALISNINLALSLVPLVLGVLALLTEWGRFVAPLWLALQLLILQPFVVASRVSAGGTRAGATFQAVPNLTDQIILYVLVIALILLVLRLLLYWDRRRLNAVDGITIAVIILAVGLTAWTLGQSSLQQGRATFIVSSLPSVAYLIGISAIIALALLCIHTFFSHSDPWLSRIESIVGILLTLSVTLGALLLLNAGQGGYISATTLNPHNLNPGLPRLPIHNQYVLDGLFVILLLIYILALVRQGWSRLFGHTERTLLLVSGFACLLVLASTERGSTLSLVMENILRLGAYGRETFTTEGVVATALLIAAFISLLWLFRTWSIANRIVLGTLFGAAALCVLVYYVSTLSPLLPCALLFLTAGTLIATRIERSREEPQALEPEDSNEVIANQAP